MIVATPIYSTDSADLIEVNRFEFFNDDGDEIEYDEKSSLISISYTIDQGRNHEIALSSLRDGYKFTSKLETMRFLGVSKIPELIEIDTGGQTASITKDFVYNEQTKVRN